MDRFPYVIQARENDSAWILAHRRELQDLLHRHGALLFRGYPLADRAQFAAFVKTLIPEESLLDYTGGTSPRVKLGEGVYTSTKMPFFLKIPLHSEMAYRKTFPKKVFFFCETAPAAGGQTPIVDIRKVYGDIPVKLRDRLEGEGIHYFRHFHNLTRIRKILARFNPMIETGTWQFVFSTEDPADVKRYARENHFEEEWLPDGSVIFKTQLPAVVIHEETGEKVWFNSFHFFQIHPRIWGRFMTAAYRLVMFVTQARDLRARTGKGQLISNRDISSIVDAYEKHQICFDWQKGDVLYLDNVLTAHGRNAFLGRRKILVSLADEGSF